MDTDSGEATTIAHLFSPEPAAAPESTATEQPLSPDVTDGYNVPPPAVEPAPAAPQVQPEPQPQVQQPQTQMVPLVELISERRERQESQRQIQQLTEAVRRLTQPQQQAPQPQPIDLLDDGGQQAFANSIIQAVEHRFLNDSLNRSENAARGAHGDHAVDAALQAAQQAGMAQSFINRPDAYGEMVKWHQGQQLLATMGANPVAYEQALRERIRAEEIAKLKQGTPPPSNLPPSLSTATRANPNTTPEVMGSDKDFFRQTMNPRRG